MSTGYPVSHVPEQARRRRHRVVAALLGVGLLAPVGVAATSAAWTDDAWFSADVSAAQTWPTAPTTSTCEVRDVGPDGVVDVTTDAVAPIPCEVQSLQAPNAWGGGDYSVGFYQWGVRLLAPGSEPSNFYVTFTVVLPADPPSGVPFPPAGWRTETAFVYNVGDQATLTSRCAALPVVSGYLPPNYGGNVSMDLAVVDRPGDGRTPLCLMP
ncbi:hypothetical protein [Cellulomonas telluris]|uniref:hypothetical protein n=1 Tax=Cellulomonas telluris TaxID=2306636 RepID=UPI0010A8C8CD|nr:hypothetical protein [Cellulomonas telluris]